MTDFTGPLDLRLLTSLHKRVKTRTMLRRRHIHSSPTTSGTRRSNPQTRRPLLPADRSSDESDKPVVETNQANNVFICPLCRMHSTRLELFVTHMSTHVSTTRVIPVTNHANHVSEGTTFLNDNAHLAMGMNCLFNNQETEDIMRKIKSPQTASNETLVGEVVQRNGSDGSQLADGARLKVSGKRQHLPMREVGHFIPPHMISGDLEQNERKTPDGTGEGVVCSICPKRQSFRNTVELVNHVQTSHLDRSYQCQCCRQNFPTLFACTKHIFSVHLDEKPNQSNQPIRTRQPTVYASPPAPWTTSPNAYNPRSEEGTREYGKSPLQSTIQPVPMSRLTSVNGDLEEDANVREMDQDVATSMLLHRLISFIHHRVQTGAQLMNSHNRVASPGMALNCNADIHTDSVNMNCSPRKTESSGLLTLKPDEKNIKIRYVDKMDEENTSDSESDKYVRVGTNGCRKLRLKSNMSSHAVSYKALLDSHPVRSLLPMELASKVDSSAASKLCHVCLQEFTDELAVLRHQVEAHSLDDEPDKSAS